MLAIALFMTASEAWSASAPVAIIQPANFEATSDPVAKEKGGLLVMLLEGNANKESERQIARFHADLGDAAFAERLAKSFACIGADAVSDACTPAIPLTGNSAQALVELSKLEHKRVLVVRLHPMKTDFRIRMRAVVNDANVNADGLKPVRVFTAVYETRVPADLEKAGKSDPAAVAAWWSEGSPTRLQREVDKGIEELRQMLSLLDREVPADNSVPAGWAELPNMDALKEAGRIKCGGGGCRTQKVLRDSGSRVWLTTPYAQGAYLYGWSIASLDDNASKKYANLLLNIQTSNP